MPSIVGTITHSVVDRGANAGIAGHDMRLISHDSPERTVKIEGFDRHSSSYPQAEIGYS